MAFDKVNECHAFVNSILRNNPDREKLATEIALKDYAIEFQFVEDFANIAMAIEKQLYELNAENIEEKQVMVKAIMINAMMQFKNRMKKAEENYKYKLNRVQIKKSYKLPTKICPYKENIRDE